MKYFKAIIPFLLLTLTTVSADAQSNRSTSTGVRRTTGERTVPRSRDAKEEPAASYSIGRREAPSSNVAWMKIVYKELDLDKDKNAALYYPEDVIDGQENLFRIVMRLVASGQVPAYEYLDGREVFTPEFKVNVADVLNRFHIPFTEAKGSTERTPRYDIDDIDVPAGEVMSYYILEKWEFDNRKNHTTATVEAICPVIHRMGEFGVETLKYPVFWVPMEALKPYLKNTAIFVDDFDNNPRYSIDDYFTMNMYDGEIYKTRNVRNKSMAQLYPDPDARHLAADSIQRQLEEFDRAIWVPSREEVIAAREAKENMDSELGEIPQRDSKESDRKPARTSRGKKKTKNEGGSSSNGNVTRSVRDRKR